MRPILFIVISIIMNLSCLPDRSEKIDNRKQQIVGDTSIKESNSTRDTLPDFVEFTRHKIQESIENKRNEGVPLVIHILVPLCDNDNQGIVRVSASLGNGQNLETNLYWGALYGFKTYFKRNENWKLEKSILNPKQGILERVLFSRVYANKAKVYLIGDAYDGSKMKECLEDYFKSLAGVRKDSLLLENGELVKINSYADLIGFNGHNGLMDVEIEPTISVDGREKDAVVIACVSHSYFKEKLNYSKGYPLLMTTNLLAPEMYILSNVIDTWVNNDEEGDFELQAAIGYNKFQKCGLKGAKRLFKSGW